MKMKSWPVIATLICSMFFFSCQKVKEKEKALTSQQIDSLSQRVVFLSRRNLDHSSRVISECIAKGANPNAVDTNGTPAIVYASQSTRNTRLNKVKVLIENGADINASNRQGETAIKYFCLYSDSACMDIALSNGVDVTVVDSFGYTPLLLLTMQVSAYNDYTGGKGSKKHRRLFYDTDLALIVSEDYNLPYIKEFLKRGADPHHKSKDGESAYSIAKEYDLNLIREAIEQHLQKDTSNEMFRMQKIDVFNVLQTG